MIECDESRDTPRRLAAAESFVRHRNETEEGSGSKKSVLGVSSAMKVSSRDGAGIHRAKTSNFLVHDELASNRMLHMIADVTTEEHEIDRMCDKDWLIHGTWWPNE